MRVVKAAAETFRPNPEFDTLEVITQLGIGEALVSTLESKGAPGVVQRTLIRPPSSRMGPLTSAERKSVLRYSDMANKYDEEVDRESAYEVLKERAEKRAEQEEKARLKEEKAKTSKKSTSRRTTTRRRSNRQSVGEAAFKTAARTLARELVRGVLGSLKRR